MKRVIVRSVFDAFEYVMAHYYPFGLEEMVERSDTYAVISIQDTHTGGFGLEFRETPYCKGVLTLYFDDTVKETDGTVLFSEDHARAIIDFVRSHREAETLLVHCYAGQSRSRAVAAFVTRMLGGDDRPYFDRGAPNRHVYDTLLSVWETEKNP